MEAVRQLHVYIDGDPSDTDPTDVSLQVIEKLRYVSHFLLDWPGEELSHLSTMERWINTIRLQPFKHLTNLTVKWWSSQCASDIVEMISSFKGLIELFVDVGVIGPGYDDVDLPLLRSWRTISRLQVVNDEDGHLVQWINCHAELPSLRHIDILNPVSAEAFTETCTTHGNGLNSITIGLDDYESIDFSRTYIPA